ncbi:SS18-like protein 2 isoform X3 [Manis pentadactyla]|uniref:SS18-like protein 2 isoform X3 n=1 Tax=Manis pentadactyla TaxID=143292 RepID=UPI00255CADDC|nr:SS18-like protein 2 isoform X3 [Manis pentadactyla]
MSKKKWIWSQTSGFQPRLSPRLRARKGPLYPGHKRRRADAEPRPRPAFHTAQTRRIRPGAGLSDPLACPITSHVPPVHVSGRTQSTPRAEVSHLSRVPAASLERVELLLGSRYAAARRSCGKLPACSPGMSVAFVPDWLRGKAEVNQETIQRLLEENDQLIRCILEHQNKGRANECVQFVFSVST